MRRFILLAMAVAMIATAYRMTPVKTVRIERKEIQKNFAFGGRVILNDGEQYNIGTVSCSKFWNGELNYLDHKYKWFK